MGRFDRYLLSQVLVLFGFFSLVLVLIYWINQAVRLFDQLIAEGQSAGVFFEITALTLPGVIKVVLPLAAFAATLYVTNKLSAESELTVVQATGYSAFRLARPIAIFGLFVSLMMMILVHVLVPVSTSTYSDRRDELAQNITARFLTEGRFMSPVDGVTLYIRDISPSGELRDVFLSDTRNPLESVTYTASLAYLVKTDAGPQLVMVEGLAQSMRGTPQTLVTTSFNDFNFDIAALAEPAAASGVGLRERPSLELLTNAAGVAADLGIGQDVVRLEFHSRNGQALLALVASLLGFSALMVGGFSRFGVWRQILVAILLAIVLKIIETSALNLARSAPGSWWLPYLNILAGLAMSGFLLFWSGRPYLFRRRPFVPGGQTA